MEAFNWTYTHVVEFRGKLLIRLLPMWGEGGGAYNRIYFVFVLFFFLASLQDAAKKFRWITPFQVSIFFHKKSLISFSDPYNLSQVSITFNLIG